MLPIASTSAFDPDAAVCSDAIAWIATFSGTSWPFFRMARSNVITGVDLASRSRPERSRHSANLANCLRDRRLRCHGLEPLLPAGPSARRSCRPFAAEQRDTVRFRCRASIHPDRGAGNCRRLCGRGNQHICCKSRKPLRPGCRASGSCYPRC
jgi:hypothetical protein